MTGSRRRYGSSFKIDVVRKVESGVSAARVARRYQLSPHLVYKWLRLYRENPEKAFKSGGSREFENLDAEARIAGFFRRDTSEPVRQPGGRGFSYFPDKPRNS